MKVVHRLVQRKMTMMACVIRFVQQRLPNVKSFDDILSMRKDDQRKKSEWFASDGLGECSLCRKDLVDDVGVGPGYTGFLSTEERQNIVQFAWVELTLRHFVFESFESACRENRLEHKGRESGVGWIGVLSKVRISPCFEIVCHLSILLHVGQVFQFGFGFLLNGILVGRWIVVRLSVRRVDVRRKHSLWGRGLVEVGLIGGRGVDMSIDVGLSLWRGRDQRSKSVRVVLRLMLTMLRIRASVSTMSLSLIVDSLVARSVVVVDTLLLHRRCRSLWCWRLLLFASRSWLVLHFDSVVHNQT